jgi:phosphoglucosamine mutase
LRLFDEPHSMAEPMGTYFGTDGIRGVAGDLLTPEFAVQVGRAAAIVVGKKAGRAPLFVIGRDTRISGPMLEAALTAGLTSGGARVELAGVIPTPGLALLAGLRGAAAGIVISASHNPFTDNGIKFFSAAGTKLSDEEEEEIEAHIASLDLPSLAGRGFGSFATLDGVVETYVSEISRRLPLDLRGLRIVVDCANGAMSEAAPLALARAGADVTVMCAAPDGTNINAGCGSTHIGALREAVAGNGYDLGLAFDGDGDRVLAVDAGGEAVDGDFIIAILATHLKAQGKLRNDTVVTTVMTNLGFHNAMRREGIDVLVTGVGDRYVVAEMLKGDYVLGGEQSGHIINRDVCTTGDGLATALLLLQALAETKAPLAEAARVMTRLPQRLVNVRVRDMGALEGATVVWAAVDDEARRLEGRGRVLVRASGTEPLVRVMAEAPTAAEVDDVCGRLVAVVSEHLGA